MPYPRTILPDVPTLSPETLAAWRGQGELSQEQVERYERERDQCCLAIRERHARLHLAPADDQYFTGMEMQRTLKGTHELPI